MGILMLLKNTWKIWAPILIVTLTAGALYAQQQKIKSLKSQRDVAIVEHDRAILEQQQLLKDIDRLNGILLKRQQSIKKLQGDFEDAKNRIRKLSEARPDVADWRNSPLPAGLWDAARNIGAPDGDPPHTNPANPDPGNSTDNQRGAAGSLP